jgi:ABC-type enterochelin transport system permease subunit
MKLISDTKNWVGAIIDLGLMLISLAILASILVGGTLPFFGGVVGNLVALVKDLGSNGLVGLIVLGIIVSLFSKRTMS